MERLEDLAESIPDRVTIKKKARVTQLIKEGGKVIGVEYQHDGKTEKAYGPVILATGGYAGDFEKEGSLLKKYRPDIFDLPTTNGDHCTGDGHKMVRPLSARSRTCLAHPCSIVPSRAWPLELGVSTSRRSRSTRPVLSTPRTLDPRSSSLPPRSVLPCRLKMSTFAPRTDFAFSASRSRSRHSVEWEVFSSTLPARGSATSLGDETVSPFDASSFGPRLTLSRPSHADVTGEMNKDGTTIRLILNGQASKEIEWHCKVN